MGLELLLLVGGLSAATSLCSAIYVVNRALNEQEEPQRQDTPQGVDDENESNTTIEVVSRDVLDEKIQPVYSRNVLNTLDYGVNQSIQEASVVKVNHVTRSEPDCYIMLRRRPVVASPPKMQN